MKLWMSAETQSDVGDDLRKVRTKIRDIINDKIQNIDYGIPLNGWDVIVILRDDERMKEIIKYSKKKEHMDFRLVMNYEQFIASNDHEKETMYFDLLLRSLMILNEKWITENGIDKLIQDVTEIGITNNWIR